MANSAIQKISRRAKQIRKAHPSKAWQSCIKQASGEYKSGKISGTSSKPRRRKVAKKKSAPRKRAPRTRKVTGVKRTTRRSIPKSKKTIGAVRSTIREQKGILKERLGDAMADQWSATTKREKKNIGKRVSMLKSQIKSLGSVINKK